MKSLSLRRRRSRGSSIVESAVVFLAVATMLIGAFDFGQFLFVHQALVERARRAARWGAVNDPSNSTAIANMVLYYQPGGATDGQAPYMGLTSSNVETAVYGAGTDDHRLRVRISGFRYTVLSPYIAGRYTGPTIDVLMPLGTTN
ncbi:MAG: pilus assembly protein [Bryobacterales bacterium]|nr:pilus assembly protein [Bryobacterales bacterium]